MFHFFTPWKRQKTFGFLTLARDIEMEGWAKIAKMGETFQAVLKI